MHPERRFWGWVVLLCVGLFALVGAQAALFYLHHGPALALLPPRLRANLLAFLALASLSALPFLVWGMRVWYRRYVLPLHRLSEDVEALLYGSPTARPSAEVDDPAGLVPLLHALMERYQQGEEAVQARLQAAQGELAAATAGLESVLDALSEGVVLFAPEGAILRANRAARTLFGNEAAFGSGAALGAGRPVTGLVEPALLEHARETLQAQLGTGVPHPRVRFECAGAERVDGAALRAAIAPLLEYGGRLAGYVLTVTPLTEALAAPDRRVPVERRAAPVQAPAAPTAREWAARPLAALRFVVFDTETTGLRPEQGDGIVSLAAVVVAGGRVAADERLDVLVNPGRPSSRAAQRVHGIPPEALAGRPALGEVLPELLHLAQGSVLVGHNVAFDLAFLQPALTAAGLRLEQPVLDTMLLSAALHPSQPSHALDSLLARYGIPAEGRHSALGDARMTAALLLRLLAQLERRGLTTLGAALEAARRTPLARLRYRG
jgi:DNA polymerase III epsilon subunit family exonuclease